MVQVKVALVEMADLVTTLDARPHQEITGVLVGLDPFQGVHDKCMLHELLQGNPK